MEEIVLDDGKLTYQKDVWESGILEKSVFKVKNISSESPEITLKLLQSLERRISGLVVIRVPESDQVNRIALEEMGYSLVETYQTFSHSLKNTQPQRERIRSYRPEDLEAVRKIARESFSTSRYHSDPKIPKESADKSREEWAVNSCNGRADIVLIPEIEGKIAGFSACNVRDSIGIIDLIAIDIAYRGKGIGTDLVNASLQFFKEKGLKSARVGTQGKNIGAIRVYENCGFRLYSTELTYHKHPSHNC